MSGDLIAILVFVMPGLVGAGTYRLLTVSRKMDQFDFVVFSFVLTVSSLLLAAFLQWQFLWSWGFTIKLLPIDELINALGDKTVEQSQVYKIITEYLFSLGFVVVNLIGLFFGITLSRWINDGKIYNRFRELDWTKKTGRIDIWQDFFFNAEWIVVTLKTGKTYYGYAEFYSDDPSKRELLLADSVELLYNETGSEYIEKKLDAKLIYLTGDDILQIEAITLKNQVPSKISKTGET